MSGVLVALGAAVAKTAFKVWTGDNPLADNVSDELTDLIAGKVGDARDRQKVANRFATIAEIVGDRVADTMRVEFRGLPEGEKNAAITAVTETLARADLHDIDQAGKVVVAASLDATALQQLVRRHTGDATKDLSRDATAFYDLVLSQCCASIVEIAHKLPNFQSDAFATLLGNDRMILERIEEVLTRLPMPSKDAVDSDEVEVDYRRVIAKDFDRLQLFGLDFAARWYPLSIAYVSLSMSARQAANGGGPGGGRLTGRERSFEQWLRSCPRLLIEGRAGGGKTTLLQWVAVRAALRDFTGPAAAYNDYVPFFLRLRAYVGRRLPTPGEFLDSAAAALGPEAGTWPSRQLRSGKAFVLVDGLDEIPEAQRSSAIAWLEGLTGSFPDARYVITSRPGAIRPDALAYEGFVTADLEPMPPALVSVFVERWHEAMRGFHQDTLALERLADCQAELLRTLDNDRFLGELANTPLLAGLICALNRNLDGELPRRRGEIYEAALKMFHKRDRRRKITADLDLDSDATNHLLSDLAVWMVRNAWTQIPGDSTLAETSEAMVTTDSARGVLRQSALSLPSRPSADADLYRHLLLRSGVLREPTAGHVDFVHRTFQEYLAAKALIRNDSVNELVSNADDDQWREIVILASGLCATNKQANDLLGGLINPGRGQQERYRRRLLAVACLGEIRHADHTVIAQIEEAIPELLPPRDMTQAEALSHAGDRLIPYLRAETNAGPEPVYIPAIVRALALTGDTQALDLLARLALYFNLAEMRPIIRDSIGDEFMRAWSYFDPERYAATVITSMALKTVEIADLKCLKGLAQAPNVDHVRISGLQVDSFDLSVLNGIPVSKVTISDSRVERLTGTIYSNSAIRSLTLHSCPRLTNISAVIQLQDLVELDVLDCQVTAKFVEGETKEPSLNRAEVTRLVTPLHNLTDLRIGYFDHQGAGIVHLPGQAREVRVRMLPDTAQPRPQDLRWGVDFTQ